MAVSKADMQATARYKSKKDNVMIYLPKGTGDLRRAHGESVSGLCNKLIAEWLKNKGVTLDLKLEITKPETLKADVLPSDSVPVGTKKDVSRIPKKRQTAHKDDTDTPTGATGGDVSPETNDNRIIDLDFFL